MNKNEKFVITINRELGSGGRTVGRKLAERLGVEFFDKALIRYLEKKFNLTTEEIEKLIGKKHSFWTDFKRVARIGEGFVLVSDKLWKTNSGEESMELTTEEMFRAESELLSSIAEEESCVIAGRSAFFVLRHHPNHLSVLIQASMDHRVARVTRKKNITPEKARKIIDQVDSMRENYVSRYTGTSRYDTRNYDVVLRADGKTEDELVDIIMQYIEEK